MVSVVHLASNRHQSVSFQNKRFAEGGIFLNKKNTTIPIIVNVVWMVNEENRFPFLDQFPQEVNEKERLANACGTRDDCSVNARKYTT